MRGASPAAWSAGTRSAVRNWTWAGARNDALGHSAAVCGSFCSEMSSIGTPAAA